MIPSFSAIDVTLGCCPSVLQEDRPLLLHLQLLYWITYLRSIPGVVVGSTSTDPSQNIRPLLRMTSLLQRMYIKA